MIASILSPKRPQYFLPSDAFSEGLVLCDVTQKGQPIVFVNEGWEKLTGYSIKDVLGLHCGSLLQVLILSQAMFLVSS